MIKKDGYYTWKKGQTYKLNAHFTTRDFQCPCSNPECVDQKISVEIIDRLMVLRELIQEPLVITSGYRCEAYQAKLEASEVSTIKDSPHLDGNAIDVKPTRMPIKDFVKLAEKLFKSIGIGSVFIHLDLRDKNQTWYY